MAIAIDPTAAERPPGPATSPSPRSDERNRDVIDSAQECRVWLGAAALAILPSIAVAQSASDPKPPAQAAAPAAQIQQAPVPPFPNRVNTVLPSWLRVRGEFRERFEGFDGANFVDGRDDYYALSRVRVNATITPSKSLSFQANVQDARVADKTIGPTT